MGQNVLEFEHLFDCDSSILPFPFEFKLSCEVLPTYACHMQLLLYVTMSCESKQVLMARWPAYRESVMSGNTYVRKT